MWKSRKTPATANIYSLPRTLWKNQMWKKIGFKRTFFFHITVFLFPLTNVEKITVNGWLLILVLISFTVSAKAGSFFICFSTCLMRVEHRRVIPVVKDLADLHHRQIGHAANEVHGDLAGSHGILDAAADRR